MRLVTYEDGFGRVDGDRIIPMGADLRTYLVNGVYEDGAPTELNSVKLHAPIPNPSKVIGIGLRVIPSSSRQCASNPTTRPNSRWSSAARPATSARTKPRTTWRATPAPTTSPPAI